MYHNCASLCSLCEGKEGAKIIYISHVSLIAGNKTKLLLNIFLCLIDKLAFVCGDSDVRTSEVNNFDFTQVGVFVLT